MTDLPVSVHLPYGRMTLRVPWLDIDGISIQGGDPPAYYAHFREKGAECVSRIDITTYELLEALQLEACIARALARARELFPEYKFQDCPNLGEVMIWRFDQHGMGHAPRLQRHLLRASFPEDSEDLDDDSLRGIISWAVKGARDEQQ